MLWLWTSAYYIKRKNGTRHAIQYLWHLNTCPNNSLHKMLHFQLFFTIYIAWLLNNNMRNVSVMNPATTANTMTAIRGKLYCTIWENQHLAFIVSERAKTQRVTKVTCVRLKKLISNNNGHTMYDTDIVKCLLPRCGVLQFLPALVWTNLLICITLWIHFP